MQARAEAMEDAIQKDALSYARLRIALERYRTAPADLDEQRMAAVDELARREALVQARILAEPEAVSVVIDEASVNSAFEGIASRYDSEAEFVADLERHGLERTALAEALRHELKVEAVTEKLLAQVEAPSDEEVEAFYHEHIEKFRLPETRELRHILVTVNDEFDGNSREDALRRLQEVGDECAGDIKRFAELAMRHSECPTAMQEGRMGRIKPGQLYPELDKVAFSMQEGEFSDAVESPMGFHILYCECCHPALEKGLDEVREQLREHLLEQRRRHRLKELLSSDVRAN